MLCLPQLFPELERCPGSAGSRGRPTAAGGCRGAGSGGLWVRVAEWGVVAVGTRGTRGAAGDGASQWGHCRAVSLGDNRLSLTGVHTCCPTHPRSTEPLPASPPPHVLPHRLSPLCPTPPALAALRCPLSSRVSPCPVSPSCDPSAPSQSQCGARHAVSPPVCPLVPVHPPGPVCPLHPSAPSVPSASAAPNPDPPPPAPPPSQSDRVVPLGPRPLPCQSLLRATPRSYVREGRGCACAVRRATAAVTGWQERAGREGAGGDRGSGTGTGLSEGPLGSTMLKKFDKKDEESGEGKGGGSRARRGGRGAL